MESDDDVENGDNDTLSLKQVADKMCKRVHVGTAVMPQPLFSADVEDFDANVALQDVANSVETRYARILRREFNAVVIEHHLKWAPLLAQDNHLHHYDFTEADRLVDWCVGHNLVVKGHVLVWHVTSPKILEEMEPEQVRTALKRHIFTVLGHYRDRIHIWDVVNEALAPDGSLADTVFLRKLGPSYIGECFQWAHEADPSATLLYNDNKVEGASPKADALYALLKELKARNLPVHGCGLQGHFNAAGTGRNRVPTPHQLKANIRRLGNLGLTVNLSELDVRISKLEEGSDVKQDAQRQIYHDLLVAALSEPSFDGLWVWGFTDRHTWVHSFYYDDEPCLLDEEYGKKPAYYGVRDALRSLTPGYRVGGDGVLLDADVDVNNKPWGHEWRLPSHHDDDETERTGDARPDWERQKQEEAAGDSDEYDDGPDLTLSDSNDEIVVELAATTDNFLPEIS